MTSSLTRLLRVTRERHRTEHELGAGTNDRHSALPVLLTVAEAADLLRTSPRAIYAMVERRQLPGVVRIRRRVLFRADVLLEWLCREPAMQPAENHAPNPPGSQVTGLACPAPQDGSDQKSDTFGTSQKRASSLGSER